MCGKCDIAQVRGLDDFAGGNAEGAVPEDLDGAVAPCGADLGALYRAGIRDAESMSETGTEESQFYGIGGGPRARL